MSFPDESTLSGIWKNDSLEGTGQYNFEDGTSIIGEFQDGQLNGKGNMYSNKMKVIYEGSFKNNVKHGPGVHYFEEIPISGKIEGTWQNDQIDGDAIYYYPDGSYLKGKWKNDKMQKSIFFPNPSNEEDLKEKNDPKLNNKRRKSENGNSVPTSPSTPAKSNSSETPKSSRKKREKNSEQTFEFYCDPSNETHISSDPLVCDPYEQQYVYVKSSKIAGEGLFAKKFLRRGMIVSFYNGFHLSHKQVTIKQAHVRSDFFLNHLNHFF